MLEKPFGHFFLWRRLHNCWVEKIAKDKQQITMHQQLTLSMGIKQKAVKMKADNGEFAIQDWS